MSALMSRPPETAPARELTARALAVGLAIGVLLAVGNVYMGLKTGWWDSGSITASILAFPLLSAWARLRGGRAAPLETNLAQTTAAAVGAAPAAAGLAGAVPALALLGAAPPGWLVAPWGLAVGTLGVLLALALRRRLLEEEALPFPTGVATAHVVRGVHGGEGAGARALVAAALASGGVGVARDLLGRIPAWTPLPGALSGAPAAAYGLGLAWSPMMLGAGLVVGPRNGAGVVLGAAVAWAVIAPVLVARGAVAAAGYGPLAAWLAWPGVGLMLGSAAVSLAAQARAFRGAGRDLGSLGAPGRAAAALAAVAALAVAGIGAAAFGLSAWQALLALPLGAVLATVCARAAGQTDISPAGEVGQLSQVAAGLAGAAPAAGVGVGSVAAGAGAQAGVSLWSLRAGRELGADPRRQAVGLLAGATLGALLAVPVYALLVRAHPPGSEALPVPGAVPWKALAEASAGGLAAIPPGAALAAAAAFAAGLLLEAAARTRAGRLLPTPGAIGMGFVAPAHFAAAIGAGALAAAIWRRARPARAEALAPVVGAGAIAGDSLAGVAAAAWAVLGPGR